MEEESRILESILAHKMALVSASPGANTAAAATGAASSSSGILGPFARSNSVDSMCSTHSLSSFGGEDRCRCDDCILGITDLLAESRLAAAAAAAAVAAAAAGGGSSGGAIAPEPTRRKVSLHSVCVCTLSPACLLSQSRGMMEDHALPQASRLCVHEH